jgi:uncharacterized protein YjiS (DUF1127 family)
MGLCAATAGETKMTDLIQKHFTAASRPFVSRSGSGSAMIRGLSEMVLNWRTRSRDRQFLLELDDRALRDIGLTRAEAYREATKPFWRARGGLVEVPYVLSGAGAGETGR